MTLQFSCVDYFVKIGVNQLCVVLLTMISLQNRVNLINTDKYPANIYLLKVTIETLKKVVKYV